MGRIPARVLGSVAWLGLSLCAVTPLGAQPDPPPAAAVRVRLERPDEFCNRVIGLFAGTRAPSPAAALAGWKLATQADNPRGLGKGTEALIALFNPEMAAELRLLDCAELTIGFDANDGRARWFATVPRDDGTFAALATALALTEGASQPPLGDALVDRLGRPGSALMARRRAHIVAAGAREDLAAGLAQIDREAAGIIERAEPGPRPDCGALLRLDPAALGASDRLRRRRLAEGLSAFGCRRLEGFATLEGETIRLAVHGAFATPPLPADARGIDPAWLTWIPERAAVAAFAMAVDNRPAAWDRAFAAADRIERVDPARANVASLRTRINLAALAARVRLEADLWPRLIGVSAALYADPDRGLDRALLALHATDDAAAERIARRVVPALARSFLAPQGGDAPPAAGDGAVTTLGRFLGAPVAVSPQGATVLIDWNGTIADSLEGHAHPEHSAAHALGAAWRNDPPHHLGAFWPGRVPGLAAQRAPAVFALAEAPPVVWTGRIQATQSHDELRIVGLRAVVRRFLEKLPMNEDALK